jgi:hypothetical protein
MDKPGTLFDVLHEHVPNLRQTMSDEEWSRFRTDLMRLQPRLDESANRRLRFAAFSELLGVCQAYPAVRRVLPPDPTTMLIEPPDPSEADDEPEPIRNRLVDVIHRMDEIDGRQAPLPAKSSEASS